MKKHFLLAMFACLLVASCTKDDIDVPVPLSEKPFFSKFWISQDCNSGLSTDYYAAIENDTTITLFCQELDSAEVIVPSFEGNFASVKVNGREQVSGTSVQDFSGIVKYELTDSVGNKGYYNVKMLVFNKIPRVSITTKDGVDITSKTDYTEATIEIGNCPETGAIRSEGRVRGRGNATWEYDKKPYKIKFTEKQSPFGFPANKDWVLLAECCDRTLLRTAYMCEACNAASMNYTIRYRHVDLFLNRKYLGTYVLTDQVEEASKRVNVERDGFLIENDHLYLSEPLYFMTDSLKLPFTFKYPDADDGDIVEGDESYNYIVSLVNTLERDVLLLEKDPADKSYQSVIDVNSFAKWYLVAELTTTFDPNLFYVLHDRTSKLEMYPMWDAEWSLGLWPMNWGASPTQDQILKAKLWNKKGFFKYLLMSPDFIKAVKTEWAKLRRNIPVIRKNVGKVAQSISLSQRTNYFRWPGQVGQPLNITFDTWDEEVRHIGWFFDERVTYMDSYINSL